MCVLMLDFLFLYKQMFSIMCGTVYLPIENVKTDIIKCKQIKLFNICVLVPL